MVSMIKEVLEDAERKKVERRSIREWLKWLKQVLFDAEDVFDKIATDDGVDDQVFLARLRELRIDNCPKLRQLPPLPPTLTKLNLWRVGLTHLPEWQLPPSSLLPSSSSSSSPCSLSSLEIRDCPELTSLAGGLLRHPLPNLVKLVIYNCRGFVSLPPDTAFGHLTSLKELVVERCPKLAWASTCESPSVDQMMPTLRRILPSSLQKLTICDIDQLDDETLSAWLQGLTSLRELSIEDCPAVTSLPRAEVLSHLTALKKLEIKRLNALSSFGGGIHCLVSLEELSIEDCPVLSHLTALKKLEIERLKALSSFGGGIHCLGSLEELIIGDCPELLDITTTTAADSSGPSSSSSALPSPARSSVGTSSTTTRIRRLEIRRGSVKQIKTWLLQCPSLQELYISRCYKDGSDDDVGGDVLEAALLNLSGTLQRLEFVGCYKLRSLPPRLRCLSSLQSLRIDDCLQIRSLPVAGLPESLRDLTIVGCPELVERCKEGVGSDWPLISHIPEDRRRIS